jgi:2,4-dienoyl-CoA reductase-like NADH-dependent reductase (Old Yellow Enzyme family)
MPSLFDPITLGAVEAPNRSIMAPLTRGRADRDAVPTDIMVEYYTQRASAGLIISEATGISREGLGWPFAPGLWTDAQVEAWKPVTASVHAAGGRIVAQLWHMGRQVHSSVIGVVSAISLFPFHRTFMFVIHHNFCIDMKENLLNIENSLGWDVI